VSTGTLPGTVREIGTLKPATGWARLHPNVATGPEARMTGERDAVGPDDAERSSAASERRRLLCPTCRQPTFWIGNPQRPFCSVTCRLIDLGVWLDEGHVVPGEAHDDDVR
jgi:endogenous inhibitor of DNA gyrase (YacG/DUF329 family)